MATLALLAETDGAIPRLKEEVAKSVAAGELRTNPQPIVQHVRFGAAPKACTNKGIGDRQSSARWHT